MASASSTTGSGALHIHTDGAWAIVEMVDGLWRARLLRLDGATPAQADAIIAAGHIVERDAHGACAAWMRRHQGPVEAVERPPVVDTPERRLARDTAAAREYARRMRDIPWTDPSTTIGIGPHPAPRFTSPTPIK